jgi:hypothetical protein
MRAYRCPIDVYPSLMSGAASRRVQLESSSGVDGHFGSWVWDVNRTVEVEGDDRPAGGGRYERDLPAGGGDPPGGGRLETLVRRRGCRWSDLTGRGRASRVSGYGSTTGRTCPLPVILLSVSSMPRAATTEPWCRQDCTPRRCGGRRSCPSPARREAARADVARLPDSFSLSSQEQRRVGRPLRDSLAELESADPAGACR